MKYEANQTVYHMGQGVTFIAYIGKDRALVEVEVYDEQSDQFDEYDDNGSGLYSHRVTVLVDVATLTDKKEDLWPAAKVELARYHATLADIQKRTDDARTEHRNLLSKAGTLKEEAKKYESLYTVFCEISGEATHYIYCYRWRGDPEVIVPDRTGSMEVEFTLEKSGGSWKINQGGFRSGDAYYLPCFGEDDLATKLVAFCENRIDCNDHSLSVKMEEFCTEHNVTSPKITAAIQKRKDMVEEEKKKRIAKAEAELASLQG